MTEEGGDERESDATETPGGGLRLSPPATFTLVWALSALALSAIAAGDGPTLVVGFALFAGVVGLLAVLADLALGRRPGTTVSLLMGVPALLGGGLAAIDGTLLTAAGLAVVGLATLGQVYGPSEDEAESGD